MRRVSLDDPHDLGAFREVARRLIAANVPPEDVIFEENGAEALFGDDALPEAAPLSVPAAFVGVAKDVICHSDPERLPLLYTLLWRVTHGERGLLSDPADPLVHRLARMAKAIRREIHKAHAFVRFRRVESEAGEDYIAWFEPAHHILGRIAPFFTGRFPAMRWSILTPIGSLHWDRETLTFGPAVPKSAAPAEDGLEEWWRDYYRSTFNPARANPRMMRAEMPKRYWRNLPEAALIPELLAAAGNRTTAMLEAEPTLPQRRIRKAEPRLDLAAAGDDLDVGANITIARLRAEAQGCTRCDLYRHATQSVFGEGPEDAKIVMVGEVPGDQEDLQGHPFVGPAGRLLDRALEEAGVDRATVYVTNVVKHFKFEPRGKKRIHKTPDRGEIQACRWWLDRELAVIRPDLVVALGGTAASSLAGRPVKVLSERGQFTTDVRGLRMLVTVHPSMILRVPDEAKADAYAAFVADLKKAA